jgi:hypothetical protein
MPTINQSSMDEAVIMTRTLSLLGYIDGLFQDHGRKPLSKRATAIRDFVRTEMQQKNPYDNENQAACCTHQYVLVEVLGEEVLDDPNLSNLNYHITEGHFSGELSETQVTYTDRRLTDELLMSQASDPSFLTKGFEQDPDQENCQE